MSKQTEKQAWAWEGFGGLTPTEKVCSVIDSEIANAKDVAGDLGLPTTKEYIKQLRELKRKFQTGKYQVFEQENER